MQIKEYSSKVKNGFGTTINQGRFMREVFKAAGFDRFPLHSDEEYAKRICIGSRPITEDMIAGFPKPYRINDLAQYYSKKIALGKIGIVATSFGINENHPDIEKLCIALAGQFFCFVDAGGAKNDVTDIVAASYEKLMCGTKAEDLLALPFHPGDRAWIINAQESRHYTKGFYESFEHVWLIRNNGTVPWEGRKMICMSQKEQSVKINAYTFDVPQTDPGEDAEINMQVDPRGREGAFESVWKMIDSDGNDCFPNEKWLFNFTVTVINQSRVSAEVML